MWLYLTYLRLSCDHSVSFVQRFGVQSLLDFFIINISYFSISKYLNKIHLQDTGQDIWHLNNWFSFFNLMSNRSYLPQLSQMKMILTFDYRLQRCTPCWGKLHGQDNFWCEVSLDTCLLTAVARSMVVAQLSVQCPCAQYSTVQYSAHCGTAPGTATCAALYHETTKHSHTGIYNIYNTHNIFNIYNIYSIYELDVYSNYKIPKYLQ